MKRRGNFQESNHRAAPPSYHEFWTTLYNPQIICKPDYIDKVRLSSEPFSRYVDVEDDKIVLKNNVMFNSESVLILNDGRPVEIMLNEGEECKHVVSGKIKMDNCPKFLRLCKHPDGIVREVTEKYIFIKESYLVD